MSYTLRSIYILTKHTATRCFGLISKEQSVVQGSEAEGEACEGWSRGRTWAEVGGSPNWSHTRDGARSLLVEVSSSRPRVLPLSHSGR